MAKASIPGYVYRTLSEGEQAKQPISPSKHAAAEARPEHAQVLKLFKQELVIRGKKGSRNRFQITEARTFQGIGDHYNARWDSKPRAKDEAVIFSVMGKPLVYVVNDAQHKVITQIRRVVPVEIQEQGFVASESTGSNLLQLRGLEKPTDVVEAFDGTDLTDEENAMHLVKSETLKKIVFCISKE